MKSKTMAALATLLGLLSITAIQRIGVSHRENRPLSDIAPYRHPILRMSDGIRTQILDYETQLKNNPHGQIVMTTLAGLYARQAKRSGDVQLFDRAEELAKRSLAEIEYLNEGARLVLADVAQARHEFQSAIALSKKVLADPVTRKGPAIEALSILVTSHLALGNLSEASQAVDRLVDLNPSVSSYVMHSWVMMAQGRDEECLYDFRTAFALETFGDTEGSVKLRDYWAKFYYKRGQYGSAKGLLREALRIQPDDPMALGLLAEIELREKTHPDAENHSVEAFSSSKQIVYLLTQIDAKRSQGDSAGAAELRDQVERLLRDGLKQPRSYAHRIELVRLLLDRGSPTDIQEAVSLAHEETLHRRNSETLFYLAKAYAKAAQWQAADKAIRDALRTGLRDAGYFLLAAKIESALGNSRKAGFYSSRAKETDAHFQSDE